MNRTPTVLSILGLTLAGALLLVREEKKPASPISSASSTPANRATGMPGQARFVESYGKLPLSFEANQGQTDSQIRFLSRGRGYTLFLTANEAVLSLRSKKRPIAQHSFPVASLLQKRTAEQSIQFRDLPAPLKKPQGLRANAAAQEGTPAGDVVRLKLVGANPRPKVVGVDELPGKSNYFIGKDPKKWRTNVPNYAKVRYQDVYPGVDLVYYGNQGQLEYDFVIAPGADPNAISLAVLVTSALSEVAGSSSPRNTPLPRIAADGDLLIKADSSEIRFHRPVVYQEQESEAQGTKPYGLGTTDASYRQSLTANRQFLDARYVLTADNHVQFEILGYDKSRPLVIDPVLSYSTYLGGSLDDEGFATAVDSSGNVYVVGFTQSPDFPIVNALQTTCGNLIVCFPDVFVTKLNAAGSALVYSTYVGGSDDDEGYGIAVDSSGNAYVTGITHSFDFPMVNALQPTCRSCGIGSNGFVAKLNTAGSALVYSTYLGGSRGDGGRGIAVDSSGNAYVTGFTISSDFPTTNPIQAAYAGGSDAFVTKFNTAGTTLVYSTFLGGSGVEEGFGIAVDSSGNAYVAGETGSIDFPTMNPIQRALAGAAGDHDAFVTKLNAAGSAPVYSTYLGGGGGDGGRGIAVDSSGNSYVTGLTLSIDFPTMNPIQAVNAGGSDAFITKLNAAGSALVYSTFLGGSGGETGFGIAVDSSGSAYVTGQTGSTDFPTMNPIQPASAGVPDVFVAKLNAAGSALAYSTYVGGSSGESGRGVAVDSFGNAYVTGETGSADFPTVNPIQAAHAGGSSVDAFVAKISTPVVLSPQSLAFGTQVVRTTSNAQTVSLTNPGAAPLTIAALGASGDFAVASIRTTCSASSPVPAGSSCQINVTFTPTASGTRTGKLRLTDSDPTSPQAVALAGIGEDFGIAVASGSSSSATVSAGGTATYTINVSPLGGFNQAVTMSCTGAPTLSSCTPSVPSVALEGTNSQNVTFTVATSASTLIAQRIRRFPLFAFSLFLMPLLAFTLVGARRRAVSKSVFVVLALLLGSLIYLAACGSGSHPPTRNPGTPFGTYTLTISGASGSLSHSTQVILKVE